MAKQSRLDSVLALAAGACAFVVYCRTVAPTVLPGDSGEFQFAAPLLGLAHPTGYPLYLLLGKLWTALVPVGDVAFRMNLLSALLSAVAVSALYLLGRRLRLDVVAALCAALVLAFSRTYWSQAVRAEVYALSSVFVIVLLYLAADERGMAQAPVGQQGTAGRRYWLVLLFALGLALTHHRTAILLIPALALLAISTRRIAWRSVIQGIGRIGPRTWLAALAALVLPLLLYLYIPLRAGATPWLRLPVGGGSELVIYHNTLADMLALVTGSVFRGSLGALDGAQVGRRLVMVVDLLRQQFGLAGMALATLGLLVMLRRRLVPALALVLAYAGVAGFCFVYFIGDISDLFTPSYIVVALWIGAGVGALADAAARALRSPGRAAALIVAAVLPVALLAGNWQANDASAQTGTRNAWEAILREPLPSGAIIVSNDRDEMTPMWYLQYVEGQRRDLVGLFPQITTAPEQATLGTLLDWLLARGQQPHLIKPMPGLELKYSLEKAGSLSRVTGYAATTPLHPQRPLASDFGGVIELAGADVTGAAAPGSAVTVTLYWRPLAPIAEDYHVFVQLLSPGGERVQGSDHRPGDVFYPSSSWMPGDVLVDRHTLTLPSSLPAGEYALVAGVYRYPAMTRLPLAGGGATMANLGTLLVR